MPNDFDDFYLFPKDGISYIGSRENVDLKSDFYNIFPFFSSPMKGISGADLVIKMGELGAMGILHRFMLAEERIKSIHKIAEKNIPFGVAIGIKNPLEEIDIASCAFEHGCQMIVVDVANGYLKEVHLMGEKLRNRFGNEISIMGGNVITPEGMLSLYNSGYNFIRLSIGSGSLCSTREQTGIGRKSSIVLYECRLAKIKNDIKLVLDGGIRNSGDCVKAFYCGADFIMMGNLFAYAKEAENNDGLIYGMASKNLHDSMNKEIKSIEGKEKQIDISEKRPIDEILNEILWGVKSACTYLGANSYKMIFEKAWHEFYDKHF